MALHHKIKYTQNTCEMENITVKVEKKNQYYYRQIESMDKSDEGKLVTYKI